MNTLLCYRMNQYSRNTAGIFAKLLGQAYAFAEVGHSVRLIYMSMNRLVLSEISHLGRLTELADIQPIPKEDERDNFWRKARALTKDNHWSPDLVYVRYDQMFNGCEFLHFLGNVRDEKNCIVVEFPTFPYALEIENETDRFKDAGYVKEIKNYVNFVCSWNPAEAIHGALNFTFNNKIHIDHALISHSELPLIADTGEIHLLAIANLMFWHGYDRLLTGLSEYLKRGESSNIHVHIVGDGEAYDALVSQTRALNLERHVTFYGFRSENELQPMYDMASVCIGSLGLHRLNIQENSTLKVRNYLSNGLPAVLASKDADLVDFSSVLYLPANDEPVDMDKVIDFVEQCNKVPQIRSEIRTFAKENLTWRRFASDLSDRVQNG